MLNFISDTKYLFLKYLTMTWRMPMWTFFGLIQPLMWLVIFGELFRGLSSLPNFPTRDYVSFLTPGVIIMTVLFGASWSGVSLLRDLRHGVMEKMFVAPIVRSSIMLSRLIHNSFTVVIQVLLLMVVAAVMGAGLPTGAGMFWVWIVVLLLGMGLSALSNAIAMILKKEEPLVVIGNMLTLPLLFFSPALVPLDFMPWWMQMATKINPVAYGVDAVRICYEGGIGQGFWIDIAVLAGFSLVSVIVAANIFQKVE